MANVVGKTWLVLVGIVAIPFYISLLGIEAFGVVGLFIGLQSLAAILDLGFGSGFSRELAQGVNAVSGRGLFTLLERGYWSAVVLLAIVAVLFAPAVGTWWLGPESNVGAVAFVLMGLSLSAQLPQALYLGGLVGLERQVQANALLAIFATVRAGGAIAAMSLVSPTLATFFGWQLAVTLLQTLVFASLIRRGLTRAGTGPGTDVRSLRRFALFSLGLGGVSAIGLVYSQIDRLVLARVVSLEELAYYVLAATLASGVYFLAVPVFAATFPRFCRLASGPGAEKIQLHSITTQLVVVLTVPVGIAISMFADPLIAAWTRDPRIAAQASPLVAPLVAGSVALALTGIHRNYQFAHGLARLPLVQSLAGLAFLAPAVSLGALAFGAEGAAWSWLLSSLLLLGLAVHATHRNLDAGSTRRWIMRDILRPVAAVAAVLALGSVASAALPAGWIGVIFPITLLSALAGVAVSDDLRRHAEARFRATHSEIEARRGRGSRHA